MHYAEIRKTNFRIRIAYSLLAMGTLFCSASTVSHRVCRSRLTPIGCNHFRPHSTTKKLAAAESVLFLLGHHICVHMYTIRIPFRID